MIPIGNMIAIREIARKQGIRVHLDGARIFNASAASGIPVAEYAAVVDSVMFCLSKGLSAPVGSILVGPHDFIEYGRRIRKALGGGMRQAGVLAAAGILALERMTDRLTEDHRRARNLAEAIAEFPEIDLDPECVETDIVIFGFQRRGYHPQKRQHHREPDSGEHQVENLSETPIRYLLFELM